jgi:tRNA dimethylallyltransferase
MSLFYQYISDSRMHQRALAFLCVQRIKLKTQPYARLNLDRNDPLSDQIATPANLLVILGPTGSGKSHLGLKLAEEFGGEIVNCDSVQVYRQLDAGSAKTPVAERRNIPHHLIDVAGIDEHFTAGDYQGLAREALASIHIRGKLPIVVGGTGFYLRALLKGLSAAPQRDQTLRDRLNKIASKRPQALHRLVAANDPLAAARIHPNDRQKLIRALEMIVLSGEAASALQERPRDGLTGVRTVKLGLNPARSVLNERLNQRCISMFEDGLIEETASLLTAGYPADSKAMQSLGYKQAIMMLESGSSRIAALQECQLKTRQYAKRQFTWFRREPDVHWLSGFGDDDMIQTEARQICEALGFSRNDGGISTTKATACGTESSDSEHVF